MTRDRLASHATQQALRGRPITVLAVARSPRLRGHPADSGGRAPRVGQPACASSRHLPDSEGIHMAGWPREHPRARGPMRQAPGLDLSPGLDDAKSPPGTPRCAPSFHVNLPATQDTRPSSPHRRRPATLRLPTAHKLGRGRSPGPRCTPRLPREPHGDRAESTLQRRRSRASSPSAMQGTNSAGAGRRGRAARPSLHVRPRRNRTAPDRPAPHRSWAASPASAMHGTNSAAAGHRGRLRAPRST